MYGLNYGENYGLEVPIDLSTLKTCEPVKIMQGTTIRWLKSFKKYPASSGWVLTYYFTGKAKFEIISTAINDDHLISVSSSESANFNAVEYEWCLYVSNGSERYSLKRGRMEVIPDPVNLPEGYDFRSHNEIMLEKIQSVLEGTADNNVLSYKIGERELNRYPIEQLKALQKEYLKEVEAEKAKRRARRSGNRTHFIQASFLP